MALRTCAGGVRADDPRVLDALVKQEFFYPSYDEANRHQTPWEMVAVMYHRVRGFIASCEVRRRRKRGKDGGGGGEGM